MTEQVKPKKTFWQRLKGLFRVRHFLQRVWAAITWKHDYKVVKVENIFWLCNIRNFIDRRISVYNGYERTQLNFLLDNMQQYGCDYFIDMGSNIGLYTMYVAKSGLADKMIAFEPDHRNYAQLNANLYLNKLTSKVDVYKLGLSDKETVVKFKLYSEKSTGQSRIVESVGEQDEELVEIKTVAADSLFNFKDKKIFVKIDVEGHEQSLIKGAENLFKNNKCFIQCETWNDNYEAVKEQFAQLGYKYINKIEADSYFSNF